jgi:hypothetical protein
MISDRLSYFAVLAVAVSASPAAATKMLCTWVQKHECAPTSGCKPVKITTYAKVDLTARRFERCDKQGCSSFSANVSKGVGGSFTNVDVTGSGMFLKLSSELTATEVVSLGHMILVSQGKCKAN